VKDERCAGTKRDGRPCKTLFFRFENGVIEIKCQRCNTMHTFKVDAYTTGSAQSIVESEEWGK